MLMIICLHAKACVADLRAVRLAKDLDAHTKPGGQIFVGDKHREWRLR